MAEKTPLDDVESPNVAVLYPTNFQITEAIKLIQLTLGDQVETLLTQSVMDETKNDCLIAATAAYVADAEHIIDQAVKLFYQQTEGLSEVVLDNNLVPYLVIRNFLWSDKE